MDVSSPPSPSLLFKGSRLFSIGCEEVSFIYTKDRINHLKTQAGDDYIID